MDNQIIFGIVGLIGVYVLYRMLSSSPRSPKVHAEQYDILHDEKYKVKGQWDR